MDYKTIKAKARSMGLTRDDLLALAPRNDPFYCGTPTEKAMAAWFAKVWNNSGFTSGVHLRRVHYRLVSNPDSKKHDGKPYENTDNSWSYICAAGKYARYLGLIDPFAFEDRRNPDPYLRNGALSYSEPGIYFDEAWDNWQLPTINTDLGSGVNWTIPNPGVYGYDYEGVNDQLYNLEVWVEKTTLESDISLVCDQLGITYLAGPGFQSITRIIGMIRRAKTYGKPTVIFYISDFDPAGDAMPVAVARQVEYWANELEAKVNIKLHPIVLTREQVIKYDLPRIPIKSSDLRRKGFEDRRGEGAVELDALEALYPGEIARILKEAAEPYRDKTLYKRLYDAEYNATDQANEEWENNTRESHDKLSDLRDQANGVYSKYRDRLEALGQELDQELEPIKAELESVRQAIRFEMDYFDPDLPERPSPGITPPMHWFMFDTSRGYMDQLAAYNRFKAVPKV